MKAYRAWSESDDEGYTTVVFAESTREAKKVFRDYSELSEDAEWIDIRVKRFPEMDKYYRGLHEVDWGNAQDRKALVSFGWYCVEPMDYMCKECTAQDICDYYQDRRKEHGTADGE